jgi:hypothetical protein
MKIIILKSVLLLSTLISYTNTFSQCNIEELKQDNLTFYFSSREEIYSNDDFENGILMAGASIVFAIENGQIGKEKFKKFSLSIYVGNYGGKEMVTPRKITLNFSDEQSINLDAFGMKPLELRGKIKYLESSFNLNEYEWEKIRNTSISSIKIRDHRTGQSLKVNPYQDLLKEQIDCILQGL